MEHYQLGDIHTNDVNLFADLSLDGSVVNMKVQSNSRMQNLLGFAINKIKADEVKQMVWYGEGAATHKATNCAEIVKRKHKNLYMLTRRGYKRVEEHWEPIYPEAGLDRLQVNRDTDAVCILLSKLPLNGCEAEKGYLGIEVKPPSCTADKKPHNKSASKSNDGKKLIDKRQNRQRQRSDKSANGSNPSSTQASKPHSIKQVPADLKLHKS